MIKNALAALYICSFLVFFGEVQAFIEIRDPNSENPRWLLDHVNDAGTANNEQALEISDNDGSLDGPRMRVFLNDGRFGLEQVCDIEGENCSTAAQITTVIGNSLGLKFALGGGLTSSSTTLAYPVINLASSVSAGGTTITTSTPHGLEQGDELLIGLISAGADTTLGTSDDVIDSTSPAVELVRIASVTSTTVFELETTLASAHASATDGVASYFDTVVNLDVDDATLEVTTGPFGILQVKDGGIDALQLAADSITPDKLSIANADPTANLTTGYAEGDIAYNTTLDQLEIYNDVGAWDALDALPVCTSTQFLQHNGTSWVCLSEAPDTTTKTVRVGWPDKIVCDTGSQGVRMLSFTTELTTGVRVYTDAFASAGYSIYFNSDGTHYQTNGWTGTDCDTKSIATLYTEGKAFNFVGGQGVVNDADDDTKILVEQTTDEDKVRVHTAGVERVVIDENGITLTGDPDPALNLTGAAAGALTYDTGSSELQYYNGTGWISVAGSSYTGGDGVTVVGTEIETAVDDATIELSASDGSGLVQIKDGGIVNAKLAADAVTSDKLTLQDADPTNNLPGAAEGDLVYNTTVSELQIFNGSTWTEVAGAGGGGGTAVLGVFVGKTSAKHNGDLSSGVLEGYEAGNALCNADYSGSHMCSEEEIIHTIHEDDIDTITDWDGNAWISAGGAKYSPADVPVNDCRGWNHGTADSYLANFWFFETTAGGGRGGVGHCANLKYIACCQ